jgi:hypothetical protein
MWTGPALSGRLVLHLGPRASVRVLRALGAAPTGPTTPTPTGPVTDTTRRRFLELAAGAVVAAGIMITGAIPAAADPVATWIKNNKQQLPRTLPGLAALPPELRSAVYQELTPAERSAAWVAHLTGYRVPTLTAAQSAVLVEALALAANPGNFAGAPAAPAVADLAARGTAAFGVDAARAIFATLGPSGETAGAANATLGRSGGTATSAVAAGTLALASCQCSTVSDYCGGHCQSGSCTPRSPGCGFLYQYSCNGHCV